MKKQRHNQPDFECSPDNYRLTDLIALEKLQRIQDAFAHANQVASTITDTDGVPITQVSNHSTVCAMIRASPQGMENCRISGEHIGLEAARALKPHQQMCLSLGFTDAAAPIIVAGKHLANWQIGQYHTRDVDEQRIRQYAREIEVDEEEMVQAFHAMPKLSTEHFEKILDFLSIMANEICLMGYTNLISLRQADELRRIHNKLEDHQVKLEEKVAQRTAELVQLNKSLAREIKKTGRIRQDQGRLLTAIEHVVEGIVITDAQAKILYVNPAMENLTGYSAHELLGQNSSILQSGLHEKHFYDELWATILQGEVWAGRFHNKRKDGTMYQEDATISSVKDEHGEIINYVAVKRDITQDLEMERQLQQMSKLEAIGTLAAGVAHEINTPVQYVSDNTRFINEALEDFMQLQALQQKLGERLDQQGLFTEERREIADFIEEIDLDFLISESTQAIGASLEGLERISTIVKAMKDFSHPGSQEKAPENINELITNTVDVSCNEWKYVADIDLDLEKTLPSVMVLAGQIKQVLLNMIINGAQAIAEKNTQTDRGKGTIHISTRQRDDTVILKIKDNGCGIPEKVLERVFDPFFTTKTVGKGTGQGLSLAYTTIVDGHGGKISAKSEPGKGAEFTIVLPIGVPAPSNRS
ncbi:MAG: PocR ligand-binding domain-containing protein [Desulfopila sp.]